MVELAPCQKPVKTSDAVHFPCVREAGHDGDCSPGRCDAATREQASTHGLPAPRCALTKGHSGPCRSLVSDDDLDERRWRDEQNYWHEDPLREALGW